MSMTRRNGFLGVFGTLSNYFQIGAGGPKIVNNSGVIELQDAAGNPLPTDPTEAINAQADSYTLVLADAGKTVSMTKATAQTLTVPLNATVAFPTGTRIKLRQTGAGALTVAATGGVTISFDTAYSLIAAGQYSELSLLKTATNTWQLTGDLKLATATGSALLAETSIPAVIGLLLDGLEVNAQADSYTLVLGDANKTIEMAKGTAQTLTIPLNATVAFPVGTRMRVVQTGAGALTIAITGGGTLNKPANKTLVLSGQHAMVVLYKTATNTWELDGELTLSEVRVSGTKVVGAQGAAVADAAAIGTYVGADTVDLAALIVTLGDLRAELNALLARVRAHGLIA